MPQAEFDPPGEKWQLRLNIVVALPPKPPRLDIMRMYSCRKVHVGTMETKKEGIGIFNFKWWRHLTILSEYKEMLNIIEIRI